ncbi:MAG: hypothetical protein ACYTXC_27585 [Nostoc sp.]
MVTEASKIEVLTQKLQEIIPELIMYNHSGTSTRYN